MNNLGFSNDNLHIGDVRIKGQNETIIIGNENGGDGYILPTEKGTEGQVLTMNADNSTSFQDGGGSGNVLLGAGLGDDITVPYNSPALALPPSFVGTQRVTYGQLPIGGSIKYYLNSRFNLDIPSAGSVVDVVKISMTTTAYRANGTFAGIDAAIVNNNAIVDFSLPLSLPINFKGYLKVEGYITRTSSDTIKLTSTAFSKEYPGIDLKCQQWVNQAQPEEITISSPQPDDYIEFLWEIRNDYYTTGTISLIRPSIYWALQNVSDATTPPILTSDHTQLTNLNLNDAGHTQFALLQGRGSGGQILSGGITPVETLTLKSHNAGLNNIVVKDLNTTFEKNIDMNQNQIDNCLVINNQAGQPLNLIGGSNVSAVILDATPTQGVIIGSNVGASTDITGDTSLSLRCNAGSIDLFPSTLMSVIIGGLPRFAVDSTEVNLGNTLNMNNNNINNVLNINSATNINLNPTGLVDCNGDIDMSSNRIIGVPEIVGDGTNMTIRNGSGISILLDQATNKVALLNNNLDMNSNNIDNANIISSSGNLTLNAGGSGQSIQMDGSFITLFQGGGSFVPTFTPSSFDMNNGGINNVSSINGYSSVGGVFAGTSDSLTLTASTAEQSILPTTFVGGLTVPANGFNIGDSFHLVLAGDFGSQNGDTINIRLYGGATSTIVLADLAVPLVSSSSVSFEVEVDFQLRNIGGAGVADICSNFDFTYNGGAGGAFRGERGVFQNNTTFSTLTNNVLLVTAQFSSNNANNSIKTSVSKLSKTF
jgi:hypothetical protein